MFTGLVRERGYLAADPAPSAQGGVRLRVVHSTALGESLSVGASLAVSGVCLTVTELAADDDAWVSTVELAPETLARTKLGDLHALGEVNLEPALRAGDALGGHFVQGHVDGVVRVLEVRELGDHREVAVELPPALAPFVVEKGSVALDGVSLTVARITDDSFAVALIPHTLEVTTLGAARPGDRLNVEVDILGKYVQRALAVGGIAGGSR
jgi:riboflavin synthase